VAAADNDCIAQRFSHGHNQRRRRSSRLPATPAGCFPE
jgi:hypothetical protein